MEQIEAFLERLLANSPEQYRSIAQKALDIYQGRGQLTVKLKAWALRAAKAQGVAVPDAFHDLPAFEPMTRTYAAADTLPEPEARVQNAGSSSKSDEREILADTMAAMTQLLAAAAADLRRP
jgi:hypothetical protein